jgi:hypothetical protein
MGLNINVKEILRDPEISWACTSINLKEVSGDPEKP